MTDLVLTWAFPIERPVWRANRAVMYSGDADQIFRMFSALGRDSRFARTRGVVPANPKSRTRFLHRLSDPGCSHCALADHDSIWVENVMGMLSAPLPAFSLIPNLKRERPVVQAGYYTVAIPIAADMRHGRLLACKSVITAETAQVFPVPVAPFLNISRMQTGPNLSRSMSRRRTGGVCS
jgi:hypothetical protein